MPSEKVSGIADVSRDVGKAQASSIFAAVFSQKTSACNNRLAILSSINASDTGEMKFAELLRNVQSLNGMNYSSQRLTYDMQILKENALIDQTSEGSYSVTKYGNYVLDVYKRIEHELSQDKTKEKPGFVGVVTGMITAMEFNLELFGEELCKVPFIKRTPSIVGNKIRLEYKDENKDFDSEIEIGEDGSFSAQIIIYEKIPNLEEAFMEDLAKTTKWLRVARSFADVALYYIERTARRLWTTSQIRVALGPDAYPLNIYSEVE